MSNAETVTPLRERQKAQTRELILDALIEALASGEPDRGSHEGLARAVGISRMTVYRYFPDRDALMQAAWDRVTELAGPKVKMPLTPEELTAPERLREVYEGFDRIAPIATLVRSTPQGRAVRLSQKSRRQASYTQAAAPLVEALPAHDRRLATAMLQLLHTTAWLEMRDHWDMDGADIAAACSWAMRALVADLQRRGSRPLAEASPPAPGGDEAKAPAAKAPT